jgi:two-component system sensor histidine kinase KdpD
MIPEYRRPDPDELLKLITAEEERENRGKLTIYFGYAPGIGKTYSMLTDAQALRKEGKDVVIGWLQTHGRKETESLAEGMASVPTRSIHYSGIALTEMDLEAILARKPEIVLVDELAHTNAPGMKHQKRYQDVEEILDAGINVYTTFNVQHLESLSDVVAKISGVAVRESIPDPVFLSSDEVKLIDLPVDELLKRLKEGKVYTRDMAQEAVNRFFEPYTLLGLRQLATREVSIRLDHRIFRYLKEHGMTGPWYASERVLVGLHASPYAAQIIRAAFRLSSEINADLIAVHVVSDQDRRFSDEEKAWLRKAVDVARVLQVKIVDLKGNDISAEIARFANENNVTKILIGKPLRHGNIRPIDRLLLLTSGIDVYIYAGQGKEPSPKADEMFKNPVNQLLKYFKG